MGHSATDEGPEEQDTRVTHTGDSVHSRLMHSLIRSLSLHSLSLSLSLCSSLQCFSASASFTPSSLALWRSALSRDGYLFLSDFLPRALVLQARNMVQRHLKQRGLLKEEGEGEEEGEEIDERAGDCCRLRAVDPTLSPNLLSESVNEIHTRAISIARHT